MQKQASAAAKPASESIDRRVLRSRGKLIDAIGRLLKQNDFNDISIQDIVDEAGLTRATFYLHYPDKAALLQAMAAERFGDLLRKRRLGSFAEADAIYALALSVCEYLSRALGCPSGLSRMPQHQFVIPVLQDLFLDHADGYSLQRGVDARAFAATLAWAIFGAASQWAQDAERTSAEVRARLIESLVRPLVQAQTIRNPGT